MLDGSGQCTTAVLKSTKEATETQIIKLLAVNSSSAIKKDRDLLISKMDSTRFIPINYLLKIKQFFYQNNFNTLPIFFVSSSDDVNGNDNQIQKCTIISCSNEQTNIGKQ